MATVDLDAIAAEIGMPSVATVEGDIERVLGPDALHALRSRPAWSKEAWATLCMASYVGTPLTKACLAAHVVRDTLYLWFEGTPGLRELLDSYDIDSQMRLAGKVYLHAHASEDPRTAQWVSERRCEQFRPPAKQVEVKVEGTQGLNIVCTRGDGVIIPPPTPEPVEEETDG